MFAQSAAALALSFTALLPFSGTTTPDAPRAASLDGGCTSRVDATPYLGTEADADLYRLYCAMFERTPDDDGFRYWSDRRREGMRLLDIAELFTSSDEVEQKYGHGDHDDFLDRVYRNVLDRPGDDDGHRYWHGKLDSGTVGRGYLLLLFAESDEFVFRTRTERHDSCRLSLRAASYDDAYDDDAYDDCS